MSRAASCSSPRPAGHGFIVPEDEVLAQTRKGKQVLNVTAGAEAAVCAPAAGDSVAVIGDNRKLLLFPLERAAGDAARQGRAAAALQGWRPGRRQDLQQEGRAQLWIDSAMRSFTLASAELKDWWGERAQAGRLPPKGFPKTTVRLELLAERRFAGFEPG